MKYKIGAVAVLLAAIALTGCEEQGAAPAPDSDSEQEYASGSKIPVNDNVYLIQGEVIAEVNEVTRQVEPAQGEVYGNNGYISGSFSGPIQAGKSFVRIRVRKVSPDTILAPLGDVVIVKTTDTKAVALLNGDVVTFKCRAQFESIAAVRENEKFDADKLGTWELDYCRLASPVITVNPNPEVEVKP